MLEWTGERYLPWIRDAAIAYEHLHRYVFASRLTEGKRVLDLASGEGYGTNMLAQTAANVVGVDIAEAAVRHANQKYSRANLNYLPGSITSIPISESHSFDVVVCFEAIEHIEAQQDLLREAKRMLDANGVFVVSTPNKQVYHDHGHDDNPFHTRELEFDEFHSLLKGFFKNIVFFGQRIHANSSIWPLSSGSSSIQEHVIARSASEFETVSANQRTPMYFIAVASDAALPAGFGGSVLIDSSDQLLNDKDREIRELLQTKESNEVALSWRAKQLASLEEIIVDLKEGLAWKDGVINGLQATIDSNEKGIAWLRAVVEGLERDKAELTARLSKASHELELIHASRGWKWIVRLRRLKSMLGGGNPRP